MQPAPVYNDKTKKGSGKLLNKVAIITGADLAFVYLCEHNDSKTTEDEVRNYGRKCMLISGDLGSEDFFNSIIQRTIDEFGKIDIFFNNAAVQFERKQLEDISSMQLIKTFTTNIFLYF